MYGSRRHWHGRFQYRIPMPLGKYRIVLHFFEVWGRESGHPFDVLGNDKVLVEDYTPRTLGRYVPVEEPAVVDVVDGMLQLDFVPHEGHVSVSGIEVIRME